jgi:hypothetical protein
MPRRLAEIIGLISAETETNNKIGEGVINTQDGEETIWKAENGIHTYMIRWWGIQKIGSQEGRNTGNIFQKIYK